MTHDNTGEFLHLCSIKSIPECKIAWLNKNIWRKLKLKLSVVKFSKNMGVFSQILIFLLLCFSIPRLEHQLISYQCSPACDFLPHFIKACPTPSSTSQMNADGKNRDNSRSILQTHSHIIAGDSAILDNISIGYKLSMFTHFNFESHHSSAACVIFFISSMSMSFIFSSFIYSTNMS